METSLLPFYPPRLFLACFLLTLITPLSIHLYDLPDIQEDRTVRGIVVHISEEEVRLKSSLLCVHSAREDFAELRVMLGSSEACLVIFCTDMDRAAAGEHSKWILIGMRDFLFQMSIVFS